MHFFLGLPSTMLMSMLMLLTFVIYNSKYMFQFTFLVVLIQSCSKSMTSANGINIIKHCRLSPITVYINSEGFKVPLKLKIEVEWRCVHIPQTDSIAGHTDHLESRELHTIQILRPSREERGGESDRLHASQWRYQSCAWRGSVPETASL